MNNPSNHHRTTTAKVEKFSTLNPLLVAMHKEFQDLSRKKPDGQVGQTKVRMVNRLLKAVHEILDGEPNRGYLDEINDDDLPQNSDVVLILGQTVAAMKAFYEKYYGWDGHTHRWFT